MNRRRFLTLAPAFLAAPALVRATSIMPVRAVQWSPPVFTIQMIGLDGSVLAETRADPVMLDHGAMGFAPRTCVVPAVAAGTLVGIAIARNGTRIAQDILDDFRGGGIASNGHAYFGKTEMRMTGP